MPYPHQFDNVIVMLNLCAMSSSVPFEDTSVVCYTVQREIESGKAARARTFWWKVVVVVDTEVLSAEERIHTAHS